MMKIKKNMIAVSAVFAFAGLVISIFIFIKLGEVKKQKEQAVFQQRALAVEREALDKLADTLESKKTDMVDIERLLPATVYDFVPFVNDVSAIATSSNMTLQFAFDKEPKKVKRDNFTHNTEGITLTLDGRYFDAILFLERFYNLPYYTRIENITIIKNKESQNIHFVGKIVLYMR